MGGKKAGLTVQLDSDELADLDGLLNIIKTRVGTLVAYLTRNTLSKPWCAAEIAVAVMTTKCKVLAVQTACFLPPEQEELNDLTSYLDLQSCNFEHYGIRTTHVEFAFKKLLGGSGVTILNMPTHVSGSRRFEALTDLIIEPKTVEDEDVVSMPRLDKNLLTGKLVISSDRNSEEATAVVCLMAMKMQGALEGLVPGGLCCLCDFEEEISVVLEALPLMHGAMVVL